VPRVQKVIAKGALTGRPKAAPSKEASGGALPGEIADTVLLKYDDRCRQQGFVFGSKGTCIEFDFPEPSRLHTDDVLVLDDGRRAEVVADIEPVLEVRTKDPAKDFAPIARLLLALGNRHVPVQILASRIRLQKRPEIEALVASQGLKGTEIAAPFEPGDEGSYGHDHRHDHHGGDHHGHGDGHHHHHGHGHGDGHGHHHHGNHDQHRHDDGHTGNHHHDEKVTPRVGGAERSETQS
jgi:urease accessory protein